MPDTDVLYQLAGVTGLGWTVLILGYLGTVIGHGHGHLPAPRSLLYPAAVLFVATVFLDRLQRGLPGGDR